MSDTLENGFMIRTINGATVTVEKYLGEGGQGIVYAVDYNGEKKALKWYKHGALKQPNAFYNNIKKNVERKSPSPEFLWPEDITEWEDETFGYIMDLRPKGYYDISDYMLCTVRFQSFKAMIDASIHIISAFRILHNQGYSYQDLNDGNFFIQPETGKVLICDNDNVAPDGTVTGILGKPRYMAPEVVLRKTMPNSLTDRFSMAVILYILFCLNHPLEGKRYLVPGLTAEMQKILYGTEPLFMMDPANEKENGPHPVVHKNSIMIWPCLPDYVQKMFLDSFGKKACEKPSARPSEVEWLKVLTRFRSDIVSCSCGNEVFTRNGVPCKCEKCGKTLNIPFRLELSDYSIPAIPGSRIYRCQLGVCRDTDALNAVAAVLANGEGRLGIRNKTEKRWDAVNSKGVPKKVASGDVVPLKNGIQLNIDGESIIIREN